MPSVFFFQLLVYERDQRRKATKSDNIFKLYLSVVKQEKKEDARELSIS